MAIRKACACPSPCCRILSLHSDFAFCLCLRAGLEIDELQSNAIFAFVSGASIVVEDVRHQRQRQVPLLAAGRARYPAATQQLHFDAPRQRIPRAGGTPTAPGTIGSRIYFSFDALVVVIMILACMLR